jgi:hypothetical protein
MSYEEELHKRQNPYSFGSGSKSIRNEASKDQQKEEYERFIGRETKIRMIGIDDQGCGAYHFSQQIRKNISFNDWKRGKRK